MMVFEAVVDESRWVAVVLVYAAGESVEVAKVHDLVAVALALSCQLRMHSCD